MANTVFIIFINHTIKLRNRIKLLNQRDDIHTIFKSPKFISLTVKSTTADSLTRSLLLRSKAQ